MAHLLGANQLTLEYPTKSVFESVSVALKDGDRIGIVGRNGDGKSTLLKLLAGRIRPDSGEVIARGGVRVGFVDQADTPDSSLLVREAVVGGAADYEWASNTAIRDVIDGILGDIDFEAAVADLSGGQQRRVSLAKVLIGEWDVLFLDEPTNHLDVSGVAWLASHLRTRWPQGQGALVVVTHDRWFLDAVTDTTWEVVNRNVDRYDGGYAAYVLQRLERRRQAEATWSRTQNLLRKELAWLRRGAPARTSKPKFRIDAAEALIESEPPVRDSVALTRVAMTRLGKDVLELQNVTAGYGDHPILRAITWAIGPGDRIGIVGVNGGGKTTLLRVLDGTLAPESGTVKRGKTVRLATLDQRDVGLAPWWNDRVADLVASHRTSYHAAGGEYSPGELLERIGFRQEDLKQVVSSLSGGQRRRLQLLVHLLAEPNVLLLDEPTNDLDTDMLAALEDVLDTWPGTLIVVSHDRYLLERVTDQQYALIDGRLIHLPRGVDQYLELLARHQTQQVVPQRPVVNSQAEAVFRPGSAEHRQATKQLQQIERRLAQRESDRKALHDEFAAADPTRFDVLQPLTERLAACEAEIRHLEQEWDEVASRLDS